MSKGKIGEGNKNTKNSSCWRKSTIYLFWKLKDLIATAKIKAKATAIPPTTTAHHPMKSCLIPKKSSRKVFTSFPPSPVITVVMSPN